jgi:hypothetical protein
MHQGVVLWMSLRIFDKIDMISEHICWGLLWHLCTCSTRNRCYNKLLPPLNKHMLGLKLWTSAWAMGTVANQTIPGIHSLVPCIKLVGNTWLGVQAICPSMWSHRWLDLSALPLPFYLETELGLINSCYCQACSRSCPSNWTICLTRAACPLAFVRWHSHATMALGSLNLIYRDISTEDQCLQTSIL